MLGCANMTGSNVRGLLLVSALAISAFGQGLDTIIFREPAGTPRFTIIDQIADASERRAFLELYRARGPHQRRKLAEEFAATYPQSWMLAQAYEIASKACIDLEDYAAALQIASQSLRLFPENPLLLVPVANVQAKLERLAQAEQSAREALDYLSRFDRPAAIGASDWPAIRADLKASSYFVLGRVALSRALAASGPQKRTGLAQAEKALSRRKPESTRRVSPNCKPGNGSRSARTLWATSLSRRPAHAIGTRPSPSSRKPSRSAETAARKPTFTRTWV